jgi:hypothetical protein
VGTLTCPGGLQKIEWAIQATADCSELAEQRLKEAGFTTP